jgi:hypothetical protein
MIFTLTFKTPDVIDQAYDQVNYDPQTQCDCEDICVDCSRLIEQAEDNKNEISSFSKKFVEYGECITIEFDSDLGTATVLPVKRR